MRLFSDQTGNSSRDSASNIFQKRPVTCFFGLALGLSWGIYSLLDVPGGLGLIPAQGPLGSVAFVVKQFSPTIAGLAVAWAAGGGAGLRAMVGAALHWRTGLRWYALVLVAFPILLLTGSVAVSGFTGQPVLAEPATSQSVALVIVAAGLIGFIGPLGEELFGWRGFALPQLLDRVGNLTASAILGGVGAVAHTDLGHAGPRQLRSRRRS